MDSLKRPPEIEDLSDEIKEVSPQGRAISDQKFEEAAEARDKEKVAGQTGTGFGKLEKDAR